MKTPLERYIATYATNCRVEPLSWVKDKPRWLVALSPIGIAWYLGRGWTIDEAFQEARILMEKKNGIPKPKKRFP